MSPIFLIVLKKDQAWRNQVAVLGNDVITVQQFVKSRFFTLTIEPVFLIMFPIPE